MFWEKDNMLISSKQEVNAFSVNRQLVNSKMFGYKFLRLPVNEDVKEAVYWEIGRLLEYADGQETEFLVAVNSYTGERIVDNFSKRPDVNRTVFTKKEMKLIEKAKTDIVLIHNHPYNEVPSYKDMAIYCNNREVRLSLVACHDGSLYVLGGVREDFRKVYNSFYEKAKVLLSDHEAANYIATKNMYLFNEQLREKNKLFYVRRL